MSRYAIVKPVNGGYDWWNIRDTTKPDSDPVVTLSNELPGALALTAEICRWLNEGKPSPLTLPEAEELTRRAS